MQPLDVATRRALLVALGVGMLPEDSHHALCDDMLHSVAPRAAAVAIGAQLVRDDDGVSTVYIHTHILYIVIYICKHMCVSIYIYIYIHTYACIPIPMYGCMGACVWIYIHISIYLYIYLYIYINIHTYIHMHAYL